MTKPWAKLEDALLAHEPQIEQRFVTAALVEADREPRLYDCTSESVVASVAISERLDMPVDSRVGAAYLSVQRRERPEALFLPGYPAAEILIRRDPEVLFVNTAVVYDRDDFRYEETSTARELVPGAPRLSRFLSAVALIAGAKFQDDGFRHVRFTGPDPGPAVAVYGEIHYRTGAVLRELVRRKDFEGKLPALVSEMEAKALDPRKWGSSDGVEDLRGLVSKKLLKRVDRTDEAGVVIYLLRGAEKASYIPRAVDVARSLGIFVKAAPKPEELAEAAKDVDEERAAVRTEREPGVEELDYVKATCCNCRVESRKARPISSAALLRTAPCPKSCKAYEGGDHHLCAKCARALARAANGTTTTQGGGEAARAAEPGADVTRTGSRPTSPASVPNPTPSEETDARAPSPPAPDAEDQPRKGILSGQPSASGASNDVPKGW